MLPLALSAMRPFSSLFLVEFSHSHFFVWPCGPMPRSNLDPGLGFGSYWTRTFFFLFPETVVTPPASFTFLLACCESRAPPFPHPVDFIFPFSALDRLSALFLHPNFSFFPGSCDSLFVPFAFFSMVKFFPVCSKQKSRSALRFFLRACQGSLFLFPAQRTQFPRKTRLKGFSLSPSRR